MRLSFNLEYFGECSKVIDFYSAIFDIGSVNVKTFKEMPMADAFGITGQGLDMVWQSILSINYENSSLCFEMSDSLLIAMNQRLDFNKLLYNPIICIAHNDENYVRVLFEKIYGNQYGFEKFQEGSLADQHGIKWMYQKNNNCGIFYCLSFNGFCSDVIAYYENAFSIKASEVIRYADSPYAGKISAKGADKIYSAILQFQHGKHRYALKLSDSIESAINGTNDYDPSALLFYQRWYNPIFTVRDSNTAYLVDSFNRLMIGAKLNKPISPTDGGAIHGSLIDKYGICWHFYSAIEDNN